jgi:predicted acylesterase/phospholipase RssA
MARKGTVEIIGRVFLALVFLGSAGCSLLRNPVPTELMADADLVAIKGVRGWGGEYSRQLQEDMVKSVRQQREGDFPLTADGSTSYTALALSGGGANGAFGAGFLCGWTEAGTRPEFKLVTGISTGALIAPAAFLGPEYDQKLRDIYTKVATEDIMDVRSFLTLLWSESLAKIAPLQTLIERNVDQEVFEAVAEAHNRGRRLYIGTTNLDAQRFVVWNMGAIATSGHPRALELFRKVMLASASIPAAFPPV